MKIEVEVDDERVLKEVVEKLFAHYRFKLEDRIDQALKGEVVLSLGAEIRRICAEKLPFLTFSDGRNLEQFIDDMLFKRSKTDPNDRNRRSRIEGMVDNMIFREADRLFNELAKPHLEDLKKKVGKGLIERVIGELANFARDT